MFLLTKHSLTDPSTTLQWILFTIFIAEISIFMHQILSLLARPLKSNKAHLWVFPLFFLYTFLGCQCSLNLQKLIAALHPVGTDHFIKIILTGFLLWYIGKCLHIACMWRVSVLKAYLFINISLWLFTSLFFTHGEGNKFWVVAWMLTNLALVVVHFSLASFVFCKVLRRVKNLKSKSPPLEFHVRSVWLLSKSSGLFLQKMNPRMVTAASVFILIISWLIAQILALAARIDHLTELVITNFGVTVSMTIHTWGFIVSARIEYNLLQQLKLKKKYTDSLILKQQKENTPHTTPDTAEPQFEQRIETQLARILEQTEYIKNNLIKQPSDEDSTEAKTLRDAQDIGEPAFDINWKLYGITGREQDIIRLIAEGLLYKEISFKLFISERTVQKHCENIFTKMHVKNRYELIKKLSQRSIP